MYYRSDWPEVGLAGPLQEDARRETVGGHGEVTPDWTDQSHVAGIGVRWAASRDRFESKLYDTPVWHLRLELDYADADAFTDSNARGLADALAPAVKRFLASGVWDNAYLCSTVVKAEPLYRSLLACGFTEVEERRVYRTRIRDLADRPWPHLDGGPGLPPWRTSLRNNTPLSGSRSSRCAPASITSRPPWP